YDAAMVRAISLLKYHAVTPLGDWFAARLAEIVAGQPELWVADVVVPVPLHATRLRERGYNQADLIARPLARRLRLPFRSYLLVRTKPRPAKLRLSRHERWDTVRGAYAIRERARVDKMHVLLVDDVFTTGATLDACAKTFGRAGPTVWQGLRLPGRSRVEGDRQVRGKSRSETCGHALKRTRRIVCSAKDGAGHCDRQGALGSVCVPKQPAWGHAGTGTSAQCHFRAD